VHHNNDHSGADQALRNIIAHSTDNLEQVERIWKASKLADGRSSTAPNIGVGRWTVKKSFDMKLDQTVAENYARATAERMQSERRLAATARQADPVATLSQYAAPAPRTCRSLAATARQRPRSPLSRHLRP
jgi:hypothetical protein